VTHPPLEFASVDVSWSGPYAQGNDVTGFLIGVSPGPASYQAAAAAGDLNVSGLVGGTAYTFTVTAVNGLGAGSPVTVGPIDPATSGSIDSNDSPSSTTAGQEVPRTATALTPPTNPFWYAPGSPDYQVDHSALPVYTTSFYADDLNINDNYQQIA